MKQTRRKFVKTGMGGVASLSTLNFPLWGLLSCGSDDAEIPKDNGLGITGVSLPPVLDVPAGGQIDINGHGFQMGDQIQWISTLDPSKKYVSALKGVGQGSASLVLPGEITTGGYRLVLDRDGETLTLG